jgi:hypothetical protein
MDFPEFGEESQKEENEGSLGPAIKAIVMYNIFSLRNISQNK